MSHTKMIALSSLVSELLPFDFFSYSPCAHHNQVTVWNILHAIGIPTESEPTLYRKEFALPCVSPHPP